MSWLTVLFYIIGGVAVYCAIFTIVGWIMGYNRPKRPKQ